MRVHAKFSGQIKTDFGFTARLGFRKEERGRAVAEAEKVLSDGGVNGRTVPICSNSGAREAKLGRMGCEECASA